MTDGKATTRKDLATYREAILSAIGENAASIRQGLERDELSVLASSSYFSDLDRLAGRLAIIDQLLASEHFPAESWLDSPKLIDALSSVTKSAPQTTRPDGAALQRQHIQRLHMPRIPHTIDLGGD
jgi:hypothetical protein